MTNTNSKRNSPIGVFDSGMGGLSVLMNLHNILPNEKFIYLGDTARVPYGNKSKDAIIEYSKQCVSFLLEQDVKLIVVACNTASSFALESIVKLAKNIPVVEMINPAIKAAFAKSVNGKIGIIGTKGTIKSESYIKALRKMDTFDHLKLFTKACPLFVPFVEEGMADHKVTEIIAHEYLDEFNISGVDTLILGCTHYPFLKSQINNVLPNINLIDTGYYSAIETKKILNEENLSNESNINSNKDEDNDEDNIDFNENLTNFDLYATDFSTDFKSVAEKYINIRLTEIKKVDISIY